MDLGPDATSRVRYARVTNRNNFPITDRCDNIVYRFPPGVDVTIPLDAAAHIFGFTPVATEEETRLHCIKRFGFNRPEVLAAKEDELFWENLEIAPVVMRMVEVEDTGQADDTPPVEVASEPLRRRAPKRRRQYRKRVLTPAAEAAPAPDAAQ